MTTVAEMIFAALWTRAQAAVPGLRSYARNPDTEVGSNEYDALRQVDADDPEGDEEIHQATATGVDRYEAKAAFEFYVARPTAAALNPACDDVRGKLFVMLAADP